MLVVDDPLVECAADTLRDGAHDLTFDDAGVDHVSAVVDDDVTTDRDLGCHGIGFDDRRVHSRSEGGTGRRVVAGCFQTGLLTLGNRRLRHVRVGLGETGGQLRLTVERIS
ncbi:hypothetical protein D9M68_930780 [compost metagenome]